MYFPVNDIAIQLFQKECKSSVFYLLLAFIISEFYLCFNHIHYPPSAPPRSTLLPYPIKHVPFM